MSLKRSLFTAFLPLLLLSLLFAACGNPTTTTTGSGYTTPAAAATTAPTTAPTAAPAAVIKTAGATVGGKAVTLLTNAQGLTLYYFTKDTATTSNCTGGCASAWPPLLFTGSGTPTADSTLPGTLSVVNTANGAQVAYQGHLLYTFASDTKPGDTNGQGVRGAWFVATTDLKAAGSGGYNNGY